ncbi:dTDP-glucose 4,6-dehydratase [Anaeromicrobium sediminis]|uniref:dTDP-glucose 4,6-dehydratase n=1 Tax=Anaeromicrobium sediminis TaxID=1478221 RepID=A0A267MKU3_9FIRM|nr:dTDP-glucose 4,6-dehydratase [Anaeromicrobium sediminis]PAB60037.1 dTDP-glucose 4,6-dehydratase [Anaeromicrobium sediminis]
MKTYLITGGAGFIGSNFTSYILKKYDKNSMIINLDKLTYAGNLNNLKSIEKHTNYKFIKGDICDETLVDSIFKNHTIDYVINFAAESHVDRSIMDSSIFTKTNVLGIQVLLDKAKKYWQSGECFKPNKKFVQISTDEVYGSLDRDGYFREETPLSPRNPYSASKAAADLIVNSYYHTHKMPINITRCSNNYGPYQFPEKFIPLIINNCLNNRKMPLYGDGKNIRDWIHVEDHCRAIDVVLSHGKPGETYNIGAHNEKENIEIAKLIIKYLNEILPNYNYSTKYISPDSIEFVKDRKGHDKRYAIDSSKIKNQLNWHSEIDFNEGIIKTLKWYLENENWLKDITSGEYMKYYNSMYNGRI